MKLVSWNVNGLRACMNKGFAHFFRDVDADFFCIQESKMNKDQGDFEFPGYQSFWNSAQKKGYSGVVIYAKEEPLSVDYGIGIERHDNEGRVITLQTPHFYLVNVYTPNSQNELMRLEYRLEWERDFLEYLMSLEKSKPVILCGDLNVAHKEIDLRHPARNKMSPGFSAPERKAFDRLLESGFVDTFRHFYPDLQDAYTWWSYLGGARQRNVGWRIDYFLASLSLKSNLKSASIHSDIYGSDHCPVELELSI